MADDAKIEWSGRTDGLPWMHRSLIWMLRYIDVRVFYVIVNVVIILYIIFSRSAYLASYHYFRKRHNKSVMGAFCSVYLNFRQFGQVVIDRFAVYAGKQFEFEIEGEEYVINAMNERNGCIMLSSHVGNYEMAGYFLRPNKRMYALMYGGEKTTIMDNRRRMLEANGIQVIVQDENWNYLYDINNAMKLGNMLTLFADRNFGSAKVIETNVLGKRANLPNGPFAIANLYKEANVLCVFVMKEKATKYKIFIDRLKSDSARGYADLFAQRLSEVVRRYPTQWYNLYEFWK